jgi:hypothetical protein
MLPDAARNRESQFPYHKLLNSLILGGPFGAAVSVSLATCRVLRGISGFWRAILLVALSSGTYFVSLCLAVGVELAVTSGKQLSMGQTNSPVSMFAGGFAGGLLVLGGAFLLVYPRSGFGAISTLPSLKVCGVHWRS